jgi:hypothetical protein
MAKNTAYYQDKRFPKELLDRVDVAASLLGIGREDVVVQSVEFMLKGVEDFGKEFSEEWKRKREQGR